MIVQVSGKRDASLNLSEKYTDITNLGFNIAYDWSGVFLSDPYLEFAHTQMMLKSIIAANIVIFVIDDPEYNYNEIITEMGAAIACKELGLYKDIWIVQTADNECIVNSQYYYHAAVKHFNSWDACCQALREYKLAPSPITDSKKIRGLLKLVIDRIGFSDLQFEISEIKSRCSQD